jgi:hypothetical protein
MVEVAATAKGHGTAPIGKSVSFVISVGQNDKATSTREVALSTATNLREPEARAGIT